MRIFLHSVVWVGMSTLAMSSIAAQPAEQRLAEPTREAEPVMTGARLESFYKEPDGKFYARLKLLPRRKLPFMTQVFRVADASQLIDIPVGSSVKFTSRHIDGENTVTSIHVVAACVRFQQCD